MDKTGTNMQMSQLILIANQLNITTMKKFVVLRNYSNENILPDVVGVFDDRDDAKVFATLNHKTNEQYAYTVAIVFFVVTK